MLAEVGRLRALILCQFIVQSQGVALRQIVAQSRAAVQPRVKVLVLRWPVSFFARSSCSYQAIDISLEDVISPLCIDVGDIKLLGLDSTWLYTFTVSCSRSCSILLLIGSTALPHCIHPRRCIDLLMLGLEHVVHTPSVKRRKVKTWKPMVSAFSAHRISSR